MLSISLNFLHWKFHTKLTNAFYYLKFAVATTIVHTIFQFEQCIGRLSKKNQTANIETGFVQLRRKGKWNQIRSEISRLCALHMETYKISGSRRCVPVWSSIRLCEPGRVTPSKCLLQNDEEMCETNKRRERKSFFIDQMYQIEWSTGKWDKSHWTTDTKLKCKYNKLHLLKLFQHALIYFLDTDGEIVYTWY